MEDHNSIIVNGYKHIAYHSPQIDNDIISTSEAYYNWFDTRRSVRDYSDIAIPKEVIENLIKTAATTPSGAHKQPWTFCAVSNPGLKTKIRIAAEKEEKESYESRMRMSDQWKEDLKPMGTLMNNRFWKPHHG